MDPDETWCNELAVSSWAGCFPPQVDDVIVTSLNLNRAKYVASYREICLTLNLTLLLLLRLFAIGSVFSWNVYLLKIRFSWILDASRVSHNCSDLINLWIFLKKYITSNMQKYLVLKKAGETFLHSFCRTSFSYPSLHNNNGEMVEWLFCEQVNHTHSTSTTTTYLQIWCVGK